MTFLPPTPEELTRLVALTNLPEIQKKDLFLSPRWTEVIQRLDLQGLSNLTSAHMMALWALGHVGKESEQGPALLALLERKPKPISFINKCRSFFSPIFLLELFCLTLAFFTGRDRLLSFFLSSLLWSESLSLLGACVGLVVNLLYQQGLGTHMALIRYMESSKKRETKPYKPSLDHAFY